MPNVDTQGFGGKLARNHGRSESETSGRSAQRSDSQRNANVPVRNSCDDSNMSPYNNRSGGERNASVSDSFTDCDGSSESNTSTINNESVANTHDSAAEVLSPSFSWYNFSPHSTFSFLFIFLRSIGID